MKQTLAIFRAVWRLTALTVVVAFAATRFVFASASRRTLAGRAEWLQRTSRAALRVLGVRWSSVGPQPQGVIVAANHLGYLDILVLSAMTPAIFVAKREVARWPIFGWFARMSGTRFIDREKRGDVARVAGELAPAIDAGVNVVLFLEGTSSNGESVLPFKSSLLKPAVEASWPAVPAALFYAVPAGFSVVDEVFWWGDMTLLPHLFNLATLPRTNAYVAWGRPGPKITDRKLLAATLHDRVATMHRTLRQCVSHTPSNSSEQPFLAEMTHD